MDLGARMGWSSNQLLLELFIANLLNVLLIMNVRFHNQNNSRIRKAMVRII